MPDEETNGHADATELDLTVNDAVSEGIRLGLETALGQTGFNDRDETLRRNLYENFGWPRDDLDGWDEDNWLALYLRNAYAKVVNDKPALTTWRDDPQVSDTDGPDASPFEETIAALDRQHGLWSYCERVDRVAGIGQHGLLLVGFRDVTSDDGLEAWRSDAAGQFDSADAVTGFKPILEAQIEDIDYGDIQSERWGKPTEYTIDLSDDIDEETEDDPLTSLRVHHSRVVDVPARPPLDDDVLARPRAEPVLNNILDIEKTLGASAEAAYRAADYGLHLNADPEKVDMSQGGDELAAELQRYEQDLQRYIRTQGMDVTRLGGDIQDPSGIIERNLDAISAETGIPKRELRGNAQGEQAGAEQDQESYFGMVAERREQYATPHIVRSIIDVLTAAGVLPQPEGGSYEVMWPPLSQTGESEQAEIDSNRAAVIAQVPGLAGTQALRYLKDGPGAIELPEDMTANELLETDDAVDAFMQLYSANAESPEDLDLTPPQGAQDAAERALALAEEHGRDIAMTETGWRRAEQLAAGEALSPADIADGTDGMGNWWARHASHTLTGDVDDSDAELALDAEEPHQDPSYVAGLGWGGPVGARWAIRMKERIEDLRDND